MKLDKKLYAQLKKMEKILERAQRENALKKKLKLKELSRLTPGTLKYKSLKQDIASIQTISDGTKKTYKEVASKFLKDVYEQFGIRSLKKVKQEHVEQILLNKISEGKSANTIRKLVHSLDYINKHAIQTRVFKEKDKINITNHARNLELLKENGVIRRSDESKRLKATPEEAERVLKEMEKYNKFYADIARYEYLTGFRISDSVRQKSKNITFDKHVTEKSKGGLTNIVYTNHHKIKEKKFIQYLLDNADSVSGRLFKQIKDEEGNFRSDRSVSKSVSQLASRCAKNLGIKGKNGETFSSHSFRSAFAYNRMMYYVKNHDRLDDIINEKIAEQPRLKQRYRDFELRIKSKVKPVHRHRRKINKYEKIQWLVSTDLNHSRQDIVRFYIPSNDIKNELKRYIK